jgi:phage shock protein PspC (stress-responsive transcriptional regulator)
MHDPVSVTEFAVRVATVAVVVAGVWTATAVGYVFLWTPWQQARDYWRGPQ